MKKQLKIEQVGFDTLKCGPFKWKPDGDSREEMWELVTPEEAGLTHFCIKNYGGVPGPGFAGWKLVSGGPFDQAGAYRSRDEAMRGVAPFLIAYYTRKARETAEKAQRQLDLINAFLREMKS